MSGSSDGRPTAAPVVAPRNSAEALAESHPLDRVHDEGGVEAAISVASGSGATSRKLTAEELESRWNSSIERKEAEAKRLRWWKFGLSVIALCAISAVVLLFYSRGSGGDYSLGYVGAAYCAFMGLFAIWIAQSIYSQAESKFKEQEEIY